MEDNICAADTQEQVDQEIYFKVNLYY